MKENIFLQAFKGCNDTVPVWFMRQAGRCLPEYRAIRSNYSLEDMFYTPEVAAKVTCLPVDLLGVDAAILFADILTLPRLMGFDIIFDPKRGPVVKPFKSFDFIHDIVNIGHVAETIVRINQSLKNNIPLIGFAGSPFTVLTYLIEGGSSTSFHKTFQFMYADTKKYHQLMHILTNNTIQYLQMQKDNGIDAFQLFDSWSGILDERTYRKFVFSYVQEIFNAIDLPSFISLRIQVSY